MVASHTCANRERIEPATSVRAPTRDQICSFGCLRRCSEQPRSRPGPGTTGFHLQAPGSFFLPTHPELSGPEPSAQAPTLSSWDPPSAVCTPLGCTWPVPEGAASAPLQDAFTAPSAPLPPRQAPVSLLSAQRQSHCFSLQRAVGVGAEWKVLRVILDLLFCSCCACVCPSSEVTGVRLGCHRSRVSPPSTKQVLSRCKASDLTRQHACLLCDMGFKGVCVLRASSLSPCNRCSETYLRVSIRSASAQRLPWARPRVRCPGGFRS